MSAASRRDAEPTGRSNRIMIKELVTDEAILSQPCEPATAEDAAVAQDLLDTLASVSYTHLDIWSGLKVNRPKRLLRRTNRSKRSLL